MVVVDGLGTGVVENTILITDTGYRLLTEGPRPQSKVGSSRGA
jgi:hypothetical protein